MKYICLILSFSFVCNSFGKILPVWQRKSHLYTKIKEEKKIYISAKSSPLKEEKKILLFLESAGHIQAPVQKTKEYLYEFENYKDISKYFEKMNYIKEKNQVYSEICAFSYCARMWIQLREKALEDGSVLIEWDVIQGSFLGMKGFFKLAPFKFNVTEISMEASYKKEKLPLPSILLDFGMEVAGRHMCASMRNYIEDKYKKSLKKKH